MNARFLVSVAYWDAGELEAGETDRRDLSEPLSLRDAIDAARAAPGAHSSTEYVEADCSVPTAARWMRAVSGDWRTGESIETTVHFPASLTPATRARLVRLLTLSRRWSL